MAERVRPLIDFGIFVCDSVKEITWIRPNKAKATLLSKGKSFAPGLFARPAGGGVSKVAPSL
jgi:hypothetical protein